MRGYVVVDGVEGVEDDVDGHGVGLGLEDLAHHLAGVVAQVLHPVEEVLQVVLLHALLHHHKGALLQEGLHELGTLFIRHAECSHVKHMVLGLLIQVTAEVLAHGDLDKDGLEELLETLGSVLECADALHDVVRKKTQGVAFSNNLLVAEIGLSDGELQNHDNVIDHEFVTTIRGVIKRYLVKSMNWARG